MYEGTTTNIMYLLMNKKPCDLAIDIGANIGWYSGYFLALGCQLISIEARDYVADVLNATVSSNIKYTGLRAEVWNRAVASDSNGKIRMKDFQVMSGNGVTDGVEVLKVSVLDILRNSQIVKSTIEKAKKKLSVSMIKIDIEGSELHALKSLAILMKLKQIYISNVFVELKPESWLHVSGFNFIEALEIFDVFFDAGFCLRKLLYTECCKGIYKTKIDHPCCKTSSATFWPNWNNFNEVPDDIFGDVFSTSAQMKRYLDNPNLKSKRTEKKPLDGDFFLSNSELCAHGILSLP